MPPIADWRFRYCREFQIRQSAIGGTIKPDFVKNLLAELSEPEKQNGMPNTGNQFEKSQRLSNLRYEIRGATYERALQLHREGYKITNLNIGNPAAFGFDTPDEIVHDIVANIRGAQGYADSRGLFAARKAVMQYYQSIGVKNTQIEDITASESFGHAIIVSKQIEIRHSRRTTR